MDAMYEYIKRKGGRITDRELSRELGMSIGAVQRGKVRLKKEGLISYEARSRRGGTEYRLEQSGAKSGAKKVIYQIKSKTTIERETRVRAREGACEDAVLAAWSKYRGRVLIEEEVAEMASWRERLGENRLIELIAAAWRRCTADRMSFGYFADYWVEPELSGAKKAEQKCGAKKVRKHAPAAATIKEPATAKVDRGEKHDERRSPAAVEKPAGEVRKSIWADAKPAGDAGDILRRKGNEPMSGLLRITVRKGNGKMPAAVVGNGVRAILRDEDRMHVFASEDDSGAEQRIGRAAQICGEDV